MKIVKKLVAVLALSTITLSLVACGNSDTSTNETPSTTTEATASKDEASEDASKIVIAKVGDSEIYKSAYDEQMAYIDYVMAYQYGEDYKDNPDALAYYEEQKEEVMQYLIESEVLLQKSKEDKNLVPTDEEIETELAAVKAQYGTEEAFNDALTQSGMTLDDLKNNIKESLGIQKLLDESTTEVEVTDEEAKEFYDAHKENYVIKPGANMAHILVPTEEEAKEVKAKYDAGQSFEELAAEYGTDGTASTGGELGFIEYDSPSYDADFLAGAKTLSEGEVSDPVKTQFGWHLIKVTNVQSEEKQETFDEVKAEIISQIQEEKQFEQFSAALDKWKSEMNIEIYEDRL